MDRLALKGLGWAVGYVTHSNASNPLIFLYLLISIFSFLTQQYDVWRNITLFYAIAFIIILVLLPSRFRSEKYNLDLKKIELGEKGKLLSEEELTTVYQPILARTRK